MTVNLEAEFFSVVQARADTASVEVDANIVKTVLREAGDYLGALPAHQAAEIIAAWLKSCDD